jgi:fucose permease
LDTTSTQRRGRALSPRAATTAVFLANGFGIGAWAASIPHLKEAFRLDDGQLSGILLAFAVGAVASMPAAGALVPRSGSGRATRWAGIAFGLALALPYLAPHAGLLAGSALLLGAANGAMDVAMNAHGSLVERHAGRPMMSSFHAAFSIGGLLGAGGRGLAASLGIGVDGWLPLLVVVLLVVSATGGLARGTVTDDGATARGAAVSRGDLRQSFPGPAIVTLAAVALLCMLVEGAMADWSAVYIAGSVPNAGGVAAAGYAAFSLAMAGGRLLGDRTVRAFGDTRVVRVGGGLAVSGLVIATLFPGVPAIAGFGLVGAGLSNVVPVVFRAAGRAGATVAGGVAMAATAGYAGFLIGPPVIGAIASVASLRVAIGALAISAALVVAAAGAVSPQRVEVPAPPWAGSAATERRDS